MTSQTLFSFMSFSELQFMVLKQRIDFQKLGTDSREVQRKIHSLPGRSVKSLVYAPGQYQSRSTHTTRKCSWRFQRVLTCNFNVFGDLEPLLDRHCFSLNLSLRGLHEALTYQMFPSFHVWFFLGLLIFFFPLSSLFLTFSFFPLYVFLSQPAQD